SFGAVSANGRTRGRVVRLHPGAGLMRKAKIALAAIVGIVALPNIPLVPFDSLESFEPFRLLEPLYPMAPVAKAQDVPCAVPIGSAEGPRFSPQQQDYRSRLHALATG